MMNYLNIEKCIPQKYVYKATYSSNPSKLVWSVDYFVFTLNVNRVLSQYIFVTINILIIKYNILLIEIYNYNYLINMFKLFFFNNFNKYYQTVIFVIKIYTYIIFIN